MIFNEFKNIENSLDELLKKADEVSSQEVIDEEQERLKYSKLKYLYNKILTYQPDRIDHNHWYYLALRRLGEKSEAIKTLEKIVTLEPQNDSEVCQKLTSFIDLENYNDAISYFLERLRKERSFKGREYQASHVLFSSYNFCQGIYENLNDCLLALISSNAGEADYYAYFLLATINVKRLRLDDSLNYFKKLYQFRKLNVFKINQKIFYWSIAQLLFKMNKYNSAIKYIRRCIRINPNDAAPYVLLAGYCESLGMDDKALFTYFEIPNPSRTVQALGSCFMARRFLSKNQFESAEVIARDAIRLDQNLSLGYRYLGFALLNRGRPQLALENLLETLKKPDGFDNDDILYNIGCIYFLNQKDYETAIMYFFRSIQYYLQVNKPFLAKYVEAHLNLAFVFKSWAEDDLNMVYYYLGITRQNYLDLGFFREAEDIEKILEIIDVDKTLQLLKEKIGNEKRIEIIEQVIGRLENLKFDSGMRRLDLNRLVTGKKKVFEFLLSTQFEENPKYELLEEADELLCTFKIAGISRQIDELRKAKGKILDIFFSDMNLDLLNGNITREALREFIEDGISKSVAGDIKKIQTDLTELRKLAVKPIKNEEFHEDEKKDTAQIRYAVGYYIIRFRNEEIHIEDNFGMQIIAYLLKHPNTPINTFDLYFIARSPRIPRKESRLIAKGIIEDRKRQKKGVDLNLSKADILAKYSFLNKESDRAEKSLDIESILSIGREVRELEEYAERHKYKIKSNEFYKKYGSRLYSAIKSVKAKLDEKEHSGFRYHIENIDGGYKYTYAPKNPTKWVTS